MRFGKTIWECWKQATDILVLYQQNAFEPWHYYVSSRYYDPEIGRWISPEPNVYEGEFDENAGLIGVKCYNKVVTEVANKI